MCRLEQDGIHRNLYYSIDYQGLACRCGSWILPDKVIKALDNV